MSTTKRVTGIGGIFFNAKDAPALQAWYKKHLGINVQDWGGAVMKTCNPKTAVAKGDTDIAAAG